MPESLLSPSQVWMYGRVLNDLTVVQKDLKPSPSGANKLLFQQLNAKDIQLARIYAMSFEGTFYNLPKPTIFVVDGNGTPVPTTGFAPSRSGQPGFGLDMDASGLAARDFEWEGDLQYWVFDKEEVSLRLDVVTGTLDEILIDATLSCTSKYPIASRGELAARGELTARGEMVARGEMIARNRFQK